MAKSVEQRKKPEKPSKDFPLTAHNRGQWCKKIKGNVRYFGPWEDPTAALARYEKEREAWERGRIPRDLTNDMPLHRLCNLFLNAKMTRVENGEMSARTWADYKKSCDGLCQAWGRERSVDDLQQDDFATLRKVLSKGRNMVSLGNSIRLIKTLLNWGVNQGKITTHPVYGDEFDLPTAKNVRQEKNSKPLRMFEAAELRRVILNASIQMRAMTLLGANCALGNTDISEMPISAVDLESGWINFPRPKTAVLRKCKLWPETVAALCESFAKRPTPKTDEARELFFVTRHGDQYVRANVEGVVSDGVGSEFSKLLRRLDIKRDGLSFYALRHGFQTIASDVYSSEVTVKFIMGHAPKSGDMSATYREFISDRRIGECVDAMRLWLWPAGSETEQIKVDELSPKSVQNSAQVSEVKPKAPRKKRAQPK